MENLYGYCAITDLFRFGQTEIIIKTMGAQGSVVYVKEAGSVREYHVPITSPATQEIRAIGAGDVLRMTARRQTHRHCSKCLPEMPRGLTRGTTLKRMEM